MKLVDQHPSRKHRLEALEKEIRKGMEQFYYTGVKLKEIRDDELYKEDGFKTWEDYCRKRWEWSPEHTRRLIVAAEYRAAIPAPPIGGNNGESKSLEWSESSVRELTRIKDKKEAARVAKKVIDKAHQGQDEKLTAGFVRKVVDEELGVDRAAKARETKAKDNGIDLRDYLGRCTGTIEGMRESLEEHIDQDAWDLFLKKDRYTVERLKESCGVMLELLYKVHPADKGVGLECKLEMTKDKNAKLEKQVENLKAKNSDLEERCRKLEQDINASINNVKPGEVNVLRWFELLASKYDRKQPGGSAEAMRILAEARNLLLEMATWTEE